MRRPVCMPGLVFVLLLSIWIGTGRAEVSHVPYPNGEIITVIGTVKWKEYKTVKDNMVLTVFLEQIRVLTPDKKASLQEILTDSEQIPTHVTETNTAYDGQSDKKKAYNKQETQKGQERESEQEIQGLICYVENENPRMGSTIVLTGTFYGFSHATNPGEFDMAKYYHILGQQGRILQGRVLGESITYSPFKEVLYGFREYLGSLIDKLYVKEEAAVMRAMLLGEKGYLDRDLKTLYQQNGIIHILSISGLHLSILGMGVYQMLKKMRCPKLVNIMLSTACMYGYGCMTGMGISVLRAFIMFAIRICADLFGRTYDMLTAMTIAALVLLVKNPLYVTHSGFLFSFSALCGIGVIVPAAKENRIIRIRADGSRKQICLKLREALFTGIMLSLSTLPIYILFYYEYPPYSFLLNLMVIPCMGILLTGGIVSVAMAICFFPFGTAVAFLPRIILLFYEKCCLLCSRLPGHTWICGRPENWQVTGFLCILALLCICNHFLTKLQFWLGILIALSLLMGNSFWGMEITLLDVGQGDGIFISDRGQYHYLIDGGSSDQKELETYRLIPFLKCRGVDRLHAVFVTHPDVDHMNGIEAMLDSYEKNGIMIDMLVLPKVRKSCQNEDYKRLESKAGAHKIKVCYIQAGESIGTEKGVMLTCLHPSEEIYAKDTNAYSTVLLLTYQDFTALFTGDLEESGEKTLMKNSLLPRRVDVLKVAHHGSKNSSSQAFLQRLEPRIALISAGEKNRYGHPHMETLERLESIGSKVYSTMEHGAVTIHVDRQIQIRGFCNALN